MIYYSRQCGKFLKQLFTAVCNFLLPITCAVCGRCNFFLCPDCRRLLPPAETISQLGDKKISHGVWSAYDYHHPAIKKLITDFKYAGQTAMTPELAEGLYWRLEQPLTDYLLARQINPSKQLLIIPLPLHPRRWRQRGYNQTDLLAKELVKINPERFTVANDILYRPIYSPAQTEKDRQTRLTLPKNTFALCPKFKQSGRDLSDRIVILLDDVLTTGTTMLRAKETLALAKPKAILIVSLAHG